ncbi:SMP-30/gluconolactonase/LRE family protein [Sphingomonas arenae]|uniref:SMP-30/gluconolactonase/LRE family protein n=1 Tax=Sphingomonas arenae TaxID=2812555 RepID=UPI0019680628|nr:SMP-30/gluconolactonase/LRE family protein [Sphingomonas arenae]
MIADSQVRCVADVHAILGEGPVWVVRERALYWVDIKGRKIFRLSEDEQLTSWLAPWRVGSLAPRESGGFIAGTEHGFAHIHPELDHFELMFDPEEDRETNRFNDGKVDRHGRFYAGTMDDEEKEATGAFYRLHTNLTCARVDDGYRVTNGPAFSPDGKLMYANDSALQVTYVFHVAPDGTPLAKREFARFEDGQGYPDGMTVDAEGCLWIAFWDGWCLRRLSPDGEIIGEVKVPVARPTSCAFGGSSLDRLYVTSASIGLSEKELETQPNAGGLFLLSPGVQGIADRPFAG